MPEPDPELVLHLDGFDGPLDLLLDLARRQKIDLARISILSLVDQFLGVIEDARRIRLELAADWLVMAAWLAWLKSRLLLPEADDPAEDPETAAATLTARLDALERMQAAARWLAARPRLGLDVFPRGAPEDLVAVDRSGLSADLAGLVRAYLAAARRAASRRGYLARRPPAWSVNDALARLERLLGRTPGWTALERYLPPLPPSHAQRRAALASTLLASLELARRNVVDLRQDHPFAPILLRPILLRPCT